jgi:hypothetical protein
MGCVDHLYIRYLDYMKKEKLQELREALGDIERMLKAMIKSLENKHLNP